MANVVIQGFPSNGAYTRSDILGYKSYSAQLGQVGTDPITAVELVNDFGPMTYDRLGVGNYRIMFPSLIPRNKLFIPSSTEYFGNGSICYTITDNSTILGYITIYPSILFPAYDSADGIVINSQDSTFTNVELETLVTELGNNGKFYFEFKVFN